jgi:hypothetical protein
MRSGGIKIAGYAEYDVIRVFSHSKHQDADSHLTKFRPGLHHMEVDGMPGGGLMSLTPHILPQTLREDAQLMRSGTKRVVPLFNPANGKPKTTESRLRHNHQ